MIKSFEQIKGEKFFAWLRVCFKERSENIRDILKFNFPSSEPLMILVQLSFDSSTLKNFQAAFEKHF